MKFGTQSVRRHPRDSIHDGFRQVAERGPAQCHQLGAEIFRGKRQDKTISLDDSIESQTNRRGKPKPDCPRRGLGFEVRDLVGKGNEVQHFAPARARMITFWKRGIDFRAGGRSRNRNRMPVSHTLQAFRMLKAESNAT